MHCIGARLLLLLAVRVLVKGPAEHVVLLLRPRLHALLRLLVMAGARRRHHAHVAALVHAVAGRREALQLLLRLVWHVWLLLLLLVCKVRNVLCIGSGTWDQASHEVVMWVLAELLQSSGVLHRRCRCVQLQVWRGEAHLLRELQVVALELGVVVRHELLNDLVAPLKDVYLQHHYSCQILA